MSDVAKLDLASHGYDIIKKLGEGGMGCVYLANDKRLHRQVAIKVVKRNNQSSPQSIEEARLQAKFNHPNIVNIFDILAISEDKNSSNYQTDSEDIAIVMEYVDGQSLQKWLQENPVDKTQKLKWLADIANAIAHIHQQGIIHCDIKPGNILIGKDGRCRVADFGIAQSKTQHKTDHRSASLAWTAPEVLSGGAFSQQSDSFSFGLLMLWLLYYQHPKIIQRLIEIQTRDEQQQYRLFAELVENSTVIEASFKPLLKSLLSFPASQRNSRLVAIATELESLYQQEVLAAETQVISEEELTPSKQNNKWSIGRKSFVSILAIMFLAIPLYFVFSYSSFFKSEPRFIAVAPPLILGKISEEQKLKLNAAFTYNLESNIVTAKNVYLISPNEFNISEHSKKPDTTVHGSLIADIGNSSGATEVISSVFNCEPTHCDVKLNRSIKSKHEPLKWVIDSTKNFVTPIESITQLISITNAQVISKLGLDIELNEALANPVLLENFIQIFINVRLKNQMSIEILDKLGELNKQNPNFNPINWLYRMIFLRLFEVTEDEHLLNTYQLFLERQSSVYKSSAYYQIDLFWLHIFRNDSLNADHIIKNLKQRNEYYYAVELEAILAFRNGNYSQAVLKFKEQHKYKKSLSILFNIAISHWYIGDTQSAIDTLSTLLEVSPKHYEGLQFLASINLVAGNIVSSIEQYEKLLSINKNSFDMGNLSVAYMIENNYEIALKLARDASLLEPNSPAIQLNLADSLNLIGDTLQAHHSYNRVLELHSSNEDFYALIESAQAHAHLGENMKAISKIELAKKMNIDHALLVFSAALVYSKAGEPKTAIFHVKEAIKAGIGEVWFTLPWFKVLCNEIGFRELLNPVNEHSLCQ